jgi:hypothetical protein
MAHLVVYLEEPYLHLCREGEANSVCTGRFLGSL